MAQDLRLCSSGNDLSSGAEDSGVLNKADFIQLRPATRPRITGQSEQLADVGQQKVWRWVLGWQGILCDLNRVLLAMRYAIVTRNRFSPELYSYAVSVGILRASRSE